MSEKADSGYRFDGRIRSACSYDVAFATKWCRSVLDEDIQERLKEIFRETALENGMEIRSLWTTSCSVRMILSLSSRMSVHTAVKRLKAASTGKLREEFPVLRSRLPCLWTNAYCACTVGNADASFFRDFMELQSEH